MLPEFVSFPKIPRLSKETITVTEKIHGTNAQIAILPLEEDGLRNVVPPACLSVKMLQDDEGRFVSYGMFAGSRNRWLSLDFDNYNFAKWVSKHQDDLWKLGPGRHYGEFFGSGVQKTSYGRTDGERDFALFNVQRWGEHNPNTPKCCLVVPTLYTGLNNPKVIDECMVDLFNNGSKLGGGWAEGVIVYYHLTRQYYKRTFEMDGGKWQG